MMRAATALAMLMTALVCDAATSDASSPPNIVVILADDLSWRDLGCYGSPWHETPQLDRLAEQGMRFTAAYAAAPICSASRAALLTGKTPARLGFEFVTKNQPGQQQGEHLLQSPPFTLDLPLSETTVAERLRDAGYHCGFFGKWHLNRHHGSYLGWSPTHGPLAQGFAEGDAEFGSHPYAYRSQAGRAPADIAAGRYPPDALSDLATAFLRDHRDERFLLYLSHYYVHDPIHTRAPWLSDKYHQRLPADAHDDRAAYGAMVETLDHLVGRLLESLDQQGLTENTVVVFTSDNGGHPNYAANGPLRGSKWNLYEGGIRVPLIVRWPGVVAAGATCDEPVTGCDLLPTLCDIAGADDDDRVQRDGRSLVPLLKDETDGFDQPRSLVWHFPYYHPETNFDARPAKIGINDFATSQTRPHSAIRRGRHKLLHFYEDDRDELYDLHRDASEQHNLAATQPQLANDLREQLDAYLQRVDARLPTGRSDGD